MPKKKQRTPLDDLQSALLALQKVDKRQIQKALNKTDWSLPGARSAYIAEKKRRDRNLLIPASKKCPVCACVKVKRREWNTKARPVVCLSCSRKK